jgi:5-methylcytosine-specific restriction endonuclease McrA
LIRVHQVRHPHFGVVGWRELLELLKQRKGRTGIRECSWCLGPVPAGSRTKCGSEACHREISGLYSWSIRTGQAFRKYGRKCLLCGAVGVLEIDHIIPVSLGGTGEIDNLRPLCTPCHKEEPKRLRTDGPNYVARGGPMIRPISAADAAVAF